MTSDRMPEDRFWIENSQLNRRAVIRGGAYAAGFALACQPISAATIQTSGEGLVQESTAFRATDGFSLPLFIARPAGDAPAPIIVVVQEIFGVHEWVKDMCRRLAKAGYYAIAPDLFARAGDATKVTDRQALFRDIVAKTPDSQVMADIDATYVWAGSHGGDGRYRGITGFCWGGRIAWLYATHSPELDVGVAFYGRLAGEATVLQPLSPIDTAARIGAPVLGLYGGRDQGIPASDIEAMRAKLKAAGKSPPSDIIVYPDAEHGFMADYRPSFNEASAQQAWAAALDWIAKYVKA